MWLTPPLAWQAKLSVRSCGGGSWWLCLSVCVMLLCTHRAATGYTQTSRLLTTFVDNGPRNRMDAEVVEVWGFCGVHPACVYSLMHPVCVVVSGLQYIGGKLLPVGRCCCTVGGAARGGVGLLGG